MNKCQEILKKQIEYAEFTENSVVCLDIKVAKELLNIVIKACKKETPVKVKTSKCFSSVCNTCRKCGALVEYDDNYCKGCGQKLNET